MNVDQILSAEFLRPEVGQQCVVKIVSDVRSAKTKFGQKVFCDVETMQGEKYTLSLSGFHVRQIRDLFGSETSAWIGKSLGLRAKLQKLKRDGGKEVLTWEVCPV